MIQQSVSMQPCRFYPSRVAPMFEQSLTTYQLVVYLYPSFSPLSLTPMANASAWYGTLRHAATFKLRVSHSLPQV